MKKLTCVIVDDEEGAHRVLQNYISKLEDVELIGSFLNALEAFHFLKKNQVDVIFLDINMPEISGFTFIKMLQDPPEIIITSAYQEYALEGFDMNVLDYLLKPIRIERFVKSIEKAKMKINTSNIKPGKTKSIDVKYEGVIKQFPLDEIFYFQSIGNYIKVVTVKKNYIVHVTTKVIESMLENSDFIRVHKSFIVNKSLIKGLENNQIILGNQKIPVGKTYKKYLSLFIR